MRESSARTTSTTPTPPRNTQLQPRKHSVAAPAPAPAPAFLLPLPPPPLPFPSLLASRTAAPAAAAPAAGGGALLPEYITRTSDRYKQPFSLNAILNLVHFTRYIYVYVCVCVFYTLTEFNVLQMACLFERAKAGGVGGRTGKAKKKKCSEYDHVPGIIQEFVLFLFVFLFLFLIFYARTHAQTRNISYHTIRFQQENHHTKEY